MLWQNQISRAGTSNYIPVSARCTYMPLSLIPASGGTLPIHCWSFLHWHPCFCHGANDATLMGMGESITQKHLRITNMTIAVKCETLCIFLGCIGCNLYVLREWKLSVSLTHSSLHKMAATSQTILSGAFSWMKNFVFWLKFYWRLFLRVQLAIIQHWFR